MRPPVNSPSGSFRAFRLRLSLALALLVLALTAAGLLITQKKIRDDTRSAVVGEFHAARAAFLVAREARLDQLRGRCASLVENSRLHAALEDDALDLLYPSARDELRDLIQPSPAQRTMRVGFYRFLGERGRVIEPPVDGGGAGLVDAATAPNLSLPRLPGETQTGYLPGKDDELVEVIATPIASTETKRPIAALVVGLDAKTAIKSATGAIVAGILTSDRLWLPGSTPAMREELQCLLSADVSIISGKDKAAAISLSSGRYLLLREALNASSAYPRAEQIFLYSLSDSEDRASQTVRRILAAGALLLIMGLIGCHLLAARLARPVEAIALDSEVNALGRERAETALELTQAELDRAARFSANASHQLKTPVAVMRAGLEELLARCDLPSEARMEIEALVEETGRLGRIIEDLLLLSRLDAGRLKLNPLPVDLSLIVESCMDDCSVLPDPFRLDISTAINGPLFVKGERGYLEQIFRNLLDNARNYNRDLGRISITGGESHGLARVFVGNTGTPIAPDQQARLFERFNRADATETTHGSGLGLSLARDLARLHGGDVQLVGSASDWTEFVVTLPLAPAPILS